MKILEAQSAVLSNFEVHQHLTEQRERYNAEAAQGKRKVPEYLRTLTNELLTYFESHPNPLSQQPFQYDADRVTQLIEKLAPYEFTKGEMIMILNMRPASGACLGACVEDAVSRLSEQQRDEVLDIISSTLGRFPEPEAEDGGAAVEATAP